MQKIAEIYEALHLTDPKVVAVASCADHEVLASVQEARQKGLIRARLYGDTEKTAAILRELGEDPGEYILIQADTEEQAAALAVRSVHEGESDILMKGLMNSGTFIKAVLHKEYGLKKPGQTLSAAAIVETEIEGRSRLLFIADPGFIPNPSLEEKKKILANTVEVMHALGYEKPKVAVLSFAETVNPKVVTSVEARVLQEMAEQGELQGCSVCGPLSLDLAVSKRSAEHKGFRHEVAGEADLLLVPSLDVGNVLLKALTFILGANCAGAVAGTTAPVVFTSRSDTAEVKCNTIAVAALIAERGKHGERTV